MSKVIRVESKEEATIAAIIDMACKENRSLTIIEKAVVQDLAIQSIGNKAIEESIAKVDTFWDIADKVLSK